MHVGAGLGRKTRRRTGGWDRPAAARARRRRRPGRRRRRRSTGRASAPAGRRASRRPRPRGARRPRSPLRARPDRDASAPARRRPGAVRARALACAPASRARLRRRSAARVLPWDDSSLWRWARPSTRRRPPTAGACRRSGSRTPAAGSPGRSAPTTGARPPRPRRRPSRPSRRRSSAAEPVTVGASDAQFERARAMLPPQVRVVELSTDDAWMRDIGPSFLTGPADEVPQALRGVDWRFNAWGGLYDGLAARRTGRRQGPRSRRRRALPGADRPGGRLDPRRRRGHRAHDRRVPAEREPQPRALPRADRAGALRLPRGDEGDLARARGAVRRDRRPRRQPRLLRAPGDGAAGRQPGPRGPDARGRRGRAPAPGRGEGRRRPRTGGADRADSAPARDHRARRRPG